MKPGRLNVQHQMIVKACDGKLLSAPVSLKDGDRVLESGAGTGESHEQESEPIINLMYELLF